MKKWDVLKRVQAYVIIGQVEAKTESEALVLGNEIKHPDTLGPGRLYDDDLELVVGSVQVKEAWKLGGRGFSY